MIKCNDRSVATILIIIQFIAETMNFTLYLQKQIASRNQVWRVTAD